MSSGSRRLPSTAVHRPDRPRTPRRRGSGTAADEDLRPGLLDRALQTLSQRHLRAPAEQLARERDVGLALPGVIDRERLEDDLGAGAGNLLDRLCQLEQRELVGIADVDGIVVARLGQRDEPADLVADVAEGARLTAVAEDRDRAVGQGLA